MCFFQVGIGGDSIEFAIFCCYNMPVRFNKYVLYGQLRLPNGGYSLQISKENKVLMTIMMACFLTPFTGSSLNMSLPDIGKEFGASTSALSWIIESFLMTSMVLIVPMGRLSDGWGKRNVFITGMELFTLSSIVIHFVTSVEVLIAVRVLQGIAAAMLFATNMAILAQAYPAERRGKAMGLATAVVYIGLAIGPVIGGFLNYRFGWRSIFYFTTIVGLLGLLMAFKCFKEAWKVDDRVHIPFGDVVLYGVALFGVMYGWSEIINDPWGKYYLIGGAILFVLFVWRQAHLEKPLLPVRIFLENRTFAFSNLASMLNYSATFAIAFLLSLYLQMIMGFDSEKAGAMLLVQSIIMSVLSPLMGSLSDRYGSAWLASSGMGVIAVGLGVMIYGTHIESVALIITALVVIGIGFAMFSAPNNNAIMGSVPPKYFGLASSVIGTVRLLGQVFSMAVVASILSRPEVGPAQAVLLHNIQYALWVFLALCVIGIVPSVIRNK